MMPMLLSLLLPGQAAGQEGAQGNAGAMLNGLLHGDAAERANIFEGMLAKLQHDPSLRAALDAMPEGSSPLFATPATLSETFSSLDLHSQSPDYAGVVEALNGLMKQLYEQFQLQQGAALEANKLSQMQEFEKQLAAIADRRISQARAEDINLQEMTREDMAMLLPLIKPMATEAGLDINALEGMVKQSLQALYQSAQPAGQAGNASAMAQAVAALPVHAKVPSATPSSMQHNMAGSVQVTPGAVGVQNANAAGQPAALQVKPGQISIEQASGSVAKAASTQTALAGQAAGQSEAVRLWQQAWQGRRDIRNVGLQADAKPGADTSMTPLIREFVATNMASPGMAANAQSQGMNQAGVNDFLFSPQAMVGQGGGQPQMMADAAASGDWKAILNQATDEVLQPSMMMGDASQAEERLARTELPAQPALPRSPQHYAGSPAEQVRVHMQQALQSGMDRITVHLEPAELGKVEVQMEMSKDGMARMLVTAEKQDTLDLLQRDARELARSLQQAGIDADAGNMEFSLKGEGQGGFGSQQFAGDDAQGGSQFGQALEDAGDILPEFAANDAQDNEGHYLVSDSALDISV